MRYVRNLECSYLDAQCVDILTEFRTYLTTAQASGISSEQ